MKVQTFVFLDLETTGLNRPIEITEICMLAVQTEDIINLQQQKHDQMVNCEKQEKDPVLPRVIDKLTLCCSPVKDIEPMATTITGLNKTDLKRKQNFDVHVGQIILSFLERQIKPVCLIAHNGYRFDFSILMSEMQAVGLMIPSNIYAVDTLIALQEIRKTPLSNQQNQCKPSLTEIIQGKPLNLKYLITSLLSNPASGLHNAEADTINLAMLVSSYPELSTWIDKNCKLIKDQQFKGLNDLSTIKQCQPFYDNQQITQDMYFKAVERTHAP